MSKCGLQLAHTLWVWDNWVSWKPSVWHMCSLPLCTFPLPPWHGAGHASHLVRLLWGSHQGVKWPWATCESPLTTYSKSFQLTVCGSSRRSTAKRLQTAPSPFTPLILVLPPHSLFNISDPSGFFLLPPNPSHIVKSFHLYIKPFYS